MSCQTKWPLFFWQLPHHKQISVRPFHSLLREIMISGADFHCTMHVEIGEATADSLNNVSVGVEFIWIWVPCCCPCPAAAVPARQRVREMERIAPPINVTSLFPLQDVFVMISGAPSRPILKYGETHHADISPN